MCLQESTYTAIPNPLSTVPNRSTAQKLWLSRSLYIDLNSRHARQGVYPQKEGEHTNTLTAHKGKNLNIALLPNERKKKPVILLTAKTPYRILTRKHLQLRSPVNSSHFKMPSWQNIDPESVIEK